MNCKQKIILFIMNVISMSVSLIIGIMLGKYIWNGAEEALFGVYLGLQGFLLLPYMLVMLTEDFIEDNNEKR